MKNFFLALLLLGFNAYADVKPPQLTPITNAEISLTDLFLLFDTSAGVTKKLSVTEADKRYAKAAGLVEQLSGFLEVPVDKTYTLDLSASYSYTINSLKIKTSSGTASATVKINGTTVTGLSAVSVSSTAAVGTATAANSVVVGDTVTLVISGSSTPIDLAFTLKVTR